MAVFEAYFDDSGSHKGAPVFTLCGYLSTGKLWAEFARVWDQKLEAWGLPEKKGKRMFHMTHAEAVDNEYMLWNPATKDCRVAELAHMVRRHTIQGFGASLRTAKYDAAMRQLLDRKSELRIQPPSQYALLFGSAFSAMKQSARFVGIDVHDIEIVFADQTPGEENESKNLWRSVVAKAGMQEPVFRSMRGRPPLQAADMLSWKIRRVMEKEGSAERAEEYSIPRHVDLLVRALPLEMDEELQFWSDSLYHKNFAGTGPIEGRA